jgi:hypothetical protein
MGESFFKKKRPSPLIFLHLAPVSARATGGGGVDKIDFGFIINVVALAP